MTMKVKAAIIGSGNIGTDLLYKALRSEIIEPVWMVGIDPESEGLKRAKELGLKTTAEGVKGLEPHIIEDKVRIAWDATSAYVHESNNLRTSLALPLPLCRVPPPWREPLRISSGILFRS